LKGNQPSYWVFDTEDTQLIHGYREKGRWLRTVTTAPFSFDSSR
jgi:hypothetical protein